MLGPQLIKLRKVRRCSLVGGVLQWVGFEVSKKKRSKKEFSKEEYELQIKSFQHH